MRCCFFVIASAVCVLSPLTHARATDLKTRVSGSSTGSGTLSRTIIDITEPPGPPGANATYTVTVPIPSGANAVAVAKALIDSINAHLGPSGFSASFASPPDSTLILMSRASRFSSCDGGTVPGVNVTSGDLLVLVQHLGHLCGALEAPAHLPARPPTAGRVVPLQNQRAAGIPYPAFCSIDAGLAVCPAGDLPFHATIRDVNNNPVPGATVLLDFSQCPQVSMCGGGPPPSPVAVLADGLGEADIPISMGAGCAGHPVRVYTDSGLLGTRAISSPDQDGDLDVDALDAAILASKVGTGDPTGDLDGDLAVSGSCQVTGVYDDPDVGLAGLTLRGLWPNIVHPGELTTIELVAPQNASLVLELFDVVGRRVRVEALGAMEPGPHRLEWRVPDGIRRGFYSLRLRTSAGERNARILIVR